MTLLHKYLTWSRPELVVDDEDDEDAEAGPLEKIRASICEIAQLYTQNYIEEFTMMEQFVETTWNLVTSLSSSAKYDIVSPCLQFVLPSDLSSFSQAPLLMCRVNAHTPLSLQYAHSLSAKPSASCPSLSACRTRNPCSKVRAFSRASARKSSCRTWSCEVSSGKACQETTCRTLMFFTCPSSFSDISFRGRDV